MRPHDLLKRLARLEGSVPPPEPPAMDPRIAAAVLTAMDDGCDGPARLVPPPHVRADDEAARRILWTVQRLEGAEADGRLDEELTAFHAEFGRVYDPAPYLARHWWDEPAEHQENRR